MSASWVGAVACQTAQAATLGATAGFYGRGKVTADCKRQPKDPGWGRRFQIEGRSLRESNKEAAPKNADYLLSCRVVHAPPDGYTIRIGNWSSHVAAASSTRFHHAHRSSSARASL